MSVYRWSVLGSRFGLLILSFYPMGSFVLRVKDDPKIVISYCTQFKTLIATLSVLLLSHEMLTTLPLFMNIDVKKKSFLNSLIIISTNLIVCVVILTFLVCLNYTRGDATAVLRSITTISSCPNFNILNSKLSFGNNTN